MQSIIGYMKEAPKEIVARKLSELMEAFPDLGTQMKLAKRTGIGQTTIGRIRRGEVNATADNLQRIAAAFGMPVGFLYDETDFAGLDEKSKHAWANTLLEEGAQEFAMLRRLDVKASAGDGNLVFMETDKGRLAFRRDFLRHIGVRESDAVLIYADGQSMEPKIPDGAILLVDTGHIELSNNDIHVIRVDGEILVKRLRKEIGGGVWIVSDNPDKGRFPDILVTPNKEDHLTIVGRVLWMGARL